MLLLNKLKEKIIYKQPHQPGFTLVEMLASLFIFVLITSLFLANYHDANERNKLILAAQEMVSNIRLAQSYALGTEQFISGDIPRGGWGVRFDKGAANYIIFADDDINQYDYDAGEDYKIINLPNGVIIDDIDLDIYANIVFSPPEPVTYINYSGTNNDKVEITLKNNKDNTTKKVLVNFFGLVDVVD